MKRVIIGFVLSLGMAVAGPQVTESTTKAEALLVNPDPASFNVAVYPSRDSSGDRKPGYKLGDKLKIYIKTDQNAYVYLFNIDPVGKVDMLLPNLSAGGDNFVKAKYRKIFPTVKDSFTYQVSKPYGVNKLLVVASERKLNTSQIASFKGKMSTSLVRNQEQLLHQLRLSLQDVNSSSWTADTAHYEVLIEGGKPSAVSKQARSDTAARVGSRTWKNVDNRKIRVDKGPSVTKKTVFNRYDAELIAAGFERISIHEGIDFSGIYERNGEKTKLKVHENIKFYTVAIEKSIVVQPSAQKHSNTPLTWRDVREWKTTVDFSSGVNMYSIFNRYDAELVADGYKILKRSQKDGYFVSEYEKYPKKAKLIVTKNKNHYAVRIERE